MVLVLYLIAVAIAIDIIDNQHNIISATVLFGNIPLVSKPLNVLAGWS